MRLFGILLAQLGLIVAIAAYLWMETGTTITLPGASVLGLPQTSMVANLDLLFDRALVFVGGCVLFLGGVVLAAAGGIVDAFRSNAPVDQGDALHTAGPGGDLGKELLLIAVIAIVIGVALWIYAQPSRISASIDPTVVTDLNSTEMMDGAIDDPAAKR